MKHPADLDLRVLAALEKDAHVADDRPRRAVSTHQFCRQDETVVVVFQPRESGAFEGVLAGLLAVAHRPRQIAHQVRQGLIRVDVVDVGLGQRAEQQSRRADRVHVEGKGAETGGLGHEVTVTWSRSRRLGHDASVMTLRNGRQPPYPSRSPSEARP